MCSYLLTAEQYSKVSPTSQTSPAYPSSSTQAGLCHLLLYLIGKITQRAGPLTADQSSSFTNVLIEHAKLVFSDPVHEGLSVLCMD